jgi:tetratricopeptide (TPR) repeat protein
MSRTLIFLLFTALAQAQSYEDLFAQAGALSAGGDYSGAIGKFREALKLRPGATEAVSNLGVMYHMAGRYAEAVEILGPVAKQNPDLFPARLILGLDLIHLQSFAEAIPNLEAARRLDPSSSEAVYGLAAAYLGADKLQLAADLYEERTKDAPGEADGWYGLGLCYERMAEAASRGLARTPGGASLDKQFLSEFLIDRGENRLAEEALREAVALRREEVAPAAQAAYRQARALAERSRAAFTRLLEMAPDAWQSRLFLGDLNRQQRHFDEAIRDYEAVAKTQPASLAPAIGLATVYWELGQFEKSEAYLQRVLAANPKARQALFQLGNIRVRQRREDEAIPLLKEYLRQQPDSLFACADLGKAYFHAGKYGEAVPYLEKARPIDEKGDLHYQLAAALRALGRPEEAGAALTVSAELRKRSLERDLRLKQPQ